MDARRPGRRGKGFHVRARVSALVLALLFTSVGLAAEFEGAAPPGGQLGATKNILVVTLDGVRWQEVFGGFDPMLADKEAGGVSYPPALAKLYARDSAEESRAAIMPFVWEVVAVRGQVFGDRGKKNVARVANPHNVSYPGYAEMLCGFVDPRLRSNDDIPNPNVTVLEWLNGRPGFEGRVAAYGAWGRIKAILNPGRSRLPVVAGWDPIPDFDGQGLSERERAINDLMAGAVRIWPEEPQDALTMAGAMEYFTRRKPRVMYVSLGEADEWAHARRYDLYLQSIRKSDEFIKRLWETAQAMPEYAGTTALVVTTDHGRGITRKDWTDHGARVPGAEGTWIAVMGPGTAALGVRGEETGQVTQAQVAATVAGLVGEDYGAAEPKAAAGLPGVVGR